MVGKAARHQMHRNRSRGVWGGPEGGVIGGNGGPVDVVVVVGHLAPINSQLEWRIWGKNSNILCRKQQLKSCLGGLSKRSESEDREKLSFKPKFWKNSGRKLTKNGQKLTKNGQKLTKNCKILTKNGQKYFASAFGLAAQLINYFEGHV